MTKTWMLVDSMNCAYRCWHALPDLHFQGVATTVTYGVLRDVAAFQKKFNADSIVFAFEGPGKGLREKEHPRYKRKRRETIFNKEEVRTHSELKKQIHRLRDRVLKKLGYQNILFEPGYEADDIIASVCQNLPEGDEAVIISNDRDLYQCLAPNIGMWDFKRIVTLHTFQKEWGLQPHQWADVKALAGCSTDGVKGIRGIGEILASKYLRGQLSKSWSAHDKIKKGQLIWDENLELVKLPLSGTPVFELKQDQLNPKEWRKLAESLGMLSLLDCCPVRTGGLSK